MEKISVVFIHGYESKPYAGPLRPFINWAENMIGEHSRNDLNLILFKSDSKIVENLASKLRKKTILVNNDNELLRKIRNLGPDIVMSDDYLLRLKVFGKIKKIVRVKTIVYIQFLYGVHSISNCFYYDQISFKENFFYKLSSFLPYKLLTSKYVEMMKTHDFFISNSKISKNLLYWLYKIPVEDTIYPPVNTETFKPSNNDGEVDSILVYLGSSGGDVNLNFLYRIIKRIVKRNLKVHLFGNEKIGKIIKKTFGKSNVKFYKNLTDVELAELYSRSLVTVCPQTWELFGYTAVESMACGTPVLAFNYFGHSETIIDGKTGLLANTENEFINKLKLLLDKRIKFNRGYIRSYTINNFSAKASADKLRETIEKVYTNER